MKKLIIITMLCITGPSFAQVDIFTKYSPTESEIIPTISLFKKKKISEKLGLTGFAFANTKIAYALVGVTYSPKKWISIGLSGGIEKNDSSGYRLGSSIWLGHKKHSLLVIGEKGYGPSNYLYRATYKCQHSEAFHFGLTAWRFHGVGPIFGYTRNFEKLRNLDVTFWAAPTVDFEFNNTPRFIIGAKIYL